MFIAQIPLDVENPTRKRHQSHSFSQIPSHSRNGRKETWYTDTYDLVICSFFIKKCECLSEFHISTEISPPLLMLLPFDWLKNHSSVFIITSLSIWFQYIIHFKCNLSSFVMLEWEIFIDRTTYDYRIVIQNFTGKIWRKSLNVWLIWHWKRKELVRKKKDR